MIPSVRSSGRIHELDSLRGVAALGVVLWHYADHFNARPFASALHPFYNAGFLLVDFFFVLSGFVIARAYWNPQRQRNAFRNIWARVARLYPLHLVTLLAVVALLAALPVSADPNFDAHNNDLKHLLLNIMLLNQSGLQDGWSFNTPAWSISTEFIVNVAFLAGIALAPKTRMACVFLLAAGGAIYYAVVRPPMLEGAFAFGFLDVNLMRCIVGFSAGVAVYLLLHRLGTARCLAAMPRSADLLGFCALLAMTALMLASRRDPPVWHYLLSILIAMACVVFIPLGIRLRALLSRRWLVFLGDISYSIYLVHYPLQLALYAVAYHLDLRIYYDKSLMLMGYLTAVIGVAALTHRFIEVSWQSRLLALILRRNTQAA